MNPKGSSHVGVINDTTDLMMMMMAFILKRCVLKLQKLVGSFTIIDHYGN